MVPAGARTPISIWQAPGIHLETVKRVGNMFPKGNGELFKIVVLGTPYDHLGWPTILDDNHHGVWKEVSFKEPSEIPQTTLTSPVF